MNKVFNTEVINLKAVVEKIFTIPTYQRPYVWEQMQIEKLLTDFYKAFQHDPTQFYFVGTILTKDCDGVTELIDGQQRFTTLWLIAFVFRKLRIKSELERFLEDSEHQLRISFEIRAEVEKYLKQLIGHKVDGVEITSSDIAQYPYLNHISSGLATIESYISKIPDSVLPIFGQFIYEQVLFVKNTTSDNLNLNQLFSTINSGGLQLEQTDIVKANLLKIIEEDKVLFGKIWETCENMNNFFEKNAREVFYVADWKNINLTKDFRFDPSIFQYIPGIEEKVNDDSNEEEISLGSVLKTNTSVYEFVPNQKKFENESEEVYCRSIINFGQLLLHTYRIHLFRERKTNKSITGDFPGTFHINRIVDVFKEMVKRNDSNEVKRFLILLWETRYVFDKYVIKWISNYDDKLYYLELVNFNRNAESNYSRTAYEKSSQLMLQSVLYFTSDNLRQFWLTPFLLFSLENRTLSPTDEKMLEYLESIDNQLSLLSGITEKDATFKLLEQSELEPAFKEDLKELVNGFKYPRIEHYWFQKLEYILWKELKSIGNFSSSDKLKFDKYRITSKNSIEHIYPQHPQYSIIIEEDVLHSFGNLVLLSVNQNSEYSRKEVNVKREEFRGKPYFDTLKSFFIFNDYSDLWNEETIENHRIEMIKKIMDHYNYAN